MTKSPFQTVAPLAARLAALAGLATLCGCALAPQGAGSAANPPARYELYTVTLQSTMDRATGEESQGASQEHGMVFRLDTFTGKTEFAPFVEASKDLHWNDVTGGDQAQK